MPKFNEVIIVYHSGEWIETKHESAWEYENDPDWLVTIPKDEITELCPKCRERS